MDKKHYDLWAEVPSPIKSRLRNVFSACAEELNAYIPAQVGGNMTKEEYLKFAEAVKEKTYSYYAFQIMYWLGLRLGELLVLTP